jgi:hypothetical protein
MSFSHSRPCRTPVSSLNSQLPTANSGTRLSIIPSAGLGSSLYSVWADTTGNTAFNSFSVVGVFTDQLHRNGRLLIRLLHSNGHTRLFRGLCPAMALYATSRFKPKHTWKCQYLKIKICFGINAMYCDAVATKYCSNAPCLSVRHFAYN